MPALIKYALGCPCPSCDGVAMSTTTLDLTIETDADVMVVDVDMAVSQTDFTCTVCGCMWVMGDIDDSLFREDGDECPGPLDEDDLDEGD